MAMRLVVLVLAAVAAVAVLLYFTQRAPVLPGGARLAVSSEAFANGSAIPALYTCDGSDLSPPVTWSGAPAGTKSFLIVMADPDAPGGVFIHWVVYNVPPNVTSLPQGVPKAPSTPYGLQAVNDFGRIGYGGPCPPPGRPHRYVITVYALDSALGLPPGASSREVISAASSHVLASGSLVGVYGRR